MANGGPSTVLGAKETSEFDLNKLKIILGDPFGELAPSSTPSNKTTPSEVAQGPSPYNLITWHLMSDMSVLKISWVKTLSVSLIVNRADLFDILFLRPVTESPRLSHVNPSYDNVSREQKCFGVAHPRNNNQILLSEVS